MSNILIREKAKEHYNLVSDPWRYIFGDDFHVGYFEKDNIDLKSATKNLIDKLSSLGDFDSSKKVLDVGCGIGEPAFYLYSKYKSKILGITISDRGEEIATATCKKKGLSEKIEFKVADILHNNFEKESFDIIWIMEVSHLVRDKKNLFKEFSRLLSKGGEVLFCDFMLNVEENLFEIAKYYRNFFRYFEEQKFLKSAFGKAYLQTTNNIKKHAKSNNLSLVSDVDISKNVLQTITHWERNVDINHKVISTHLTKDQINDFLTSCKILRSLFNDRILTYKLLKLVKN